MSIKKPPHLYFNSVVLSPMCIGFFKHSIVLPDNQLDDLTHMHYIFMHANKKNTVTSYEYDSRNRLETESKKYDVTEEIIHYRYDFNGNLLYREWEKFTPRDPNKKKEPGRVGFYSDKFKQDVVILEMREYNGFNELVYLYRDTLETRYTYRTDRLRHKKLYADGSSHSHIWDGQNICAEYVASGNVVVRYHRGINLVAREMDGLLQYYVFNAHALDIETPKKEIVVSTGQDIAAPKENTGSLEYLIFNSHFIV